jgi:hypothetical protein
MMMFSAYATAVPVVLAQVTLHRLSPVFAQFPDCVRLDIACYSCAHMVTFKVVSIQIVALDQWMICQMICKIFTSRYLPRTMCRRQCLLSMLTSTMSVSYQHLISPGAWGILYCSRAAATILSLGPKVVTLITCCNS